MFYSLEAGKHHFAAQIAADPGMLHELCFDLEQYARTCPLPVGTEEIKTLLGEAMTNAIVHGNGRNKMLQVGMRLEYEPEASLRISVTQAGISFDPLTVLDEQGVPRRKEGGLYRIHALGYSLSFADNGRTLRMEKFLQSTDDAAFPVS